MGIKIAIQGIKGSYHHEAAKLYFSNENIDIVPCLDFEDLFLALRDHQADYALMAIENTTAGTLLPNYSLLKNNPYSISGEVFLKIGLQLMAMPGVSISDLRKIYSHPIALMQARNFLNTLQEIEITEAKDTALSASIISEKKDKQAAAIGSSIAAEIFGLEIIAGNIESYATNFTRFLVIGHETQNEQTLEKEPIKSTLCFNLNHEVGSLSKVLETFAIHKLNLTKIQSIPIPGKEWEYTFFTDLFYHSRNNYKEAVNQLNDFATDIRIFGEYKAGKGNHQELLNQ